jgi:hypothetical protein
MKYTLGIYYLIANRSVLKRYTNYMQTFSIKLKTFFWLSKYLDPFIDSDLAISSNKFIKIWNISS